MVIVGSTRPRVGCLGVGWIGRNRLEAMVGTGLIEVAAIADPSDANAEAALVLADGARRVDTLDDLLDLSLDGLVIATPSAMHAEQAIRALDRGVAVFCQKPLGRNAAETRAVVDAARSADRLLGVDLSYRHTAAMTQLVPLVRSGELGRIFAVDLTFHNAYGPDKPWFYDPVQSGGGCVIDLGVHLIDLALWALDFPEVATVHSSLFAQGQPLTDRGRQVEDYAVATLKIAGGPVVRLACSWRLQAGCDAVIAASFYGTEGGAGFHNERGSFYDFTAERYAGTQRTTLTSPPDDWGGRAAVDWTTRLASGARFDPAASHHADVASVLDRIYGDP